MNDNRMKMNLQFFAEDKTTISNLIEPAVFNPYVMEQLKEQDFLIKSGIVYQDNELDALAQTGGRLLNMPYFKDLTGEDETLDDQEALSTDIITAGQDIAALLMRGKAWAVNDIAEALSGADPMKAIGDLVVRYWLGREQATLFALLKGVFASGTMNANIHDISTNQDPKFSGGSFITAKNKLGDNLNKLTAVAVHSQTYTYMEQQNLIDTIPDSNADVGFGTYMKKTIIVDDDCPVNGDTFTTYLFGPGAIGKGEGKVKKQTEPARDALAGDDILINRRSFILHPRGVAFTNASVSKKFPTNADLEKGQNWNRVYDPKTIRLVQFKHQLG